MSARNLNSATPRLRHVNENNFRGFVIVLHYHRFLLLISEMRLSS